MWKLEFIEGGIIYVKQELNNLLLSDFIIKEESKFMYLEKNPKIKIDIIKNLRTITKAYSVLESPKLTPKYIAKNKSILGNLVKEIIELDEFDTFFIQCAGDDTPEIKSILRYISQEFKLEYDNNNPDLKIHIIKIKDLWEIGVQITTRPLSTRSYRISHISGALNPTIASGMNLLADIQSAKSYLNPFSGSGTFLIEALISNPNLQEIIGFDIDKSALTASIQNIKEAGFIRKIKIKSLDITDNLDLGKFDIITADLPFGMVISKHTNLEDLYQKFIELSKNHLAKNGKMIAITSEIDLFRKTIQKSKLKIIKEISLKQITSVNSYLKTSIFLCK